MFRSLGLVCALALVLVVLLPSSTLAAADEDLVVSTRLQQMIEKDQRQFLAKVPSSLKSSHQLGAVASEAVYDSELASLLRWHSATAYCTDLTAIQDWSCSTCREFGNFTVTAIMENDANQGYVGYFTQGLPTSPINDGSYPNTPSNEPYVVVAFRGTVPTNLKDWIEDLSFSKFAAFSSSYPGVKVHSGFWSSYQSLKADMLTGLEKALQESGATTVLALGHSLGAAMAELAAIDLRLNEYPDLEYASYTQGCPRVGNAAFSELFMQQMNASFREVHHRDVVPHLPPMWLDFEHAPLEVFWNEPFTSYRVCNSTMSGEDKQCSDGFLTPISISDHLVYDIDIGGYCSNVKSSDVLKAAVKEAVKPSTPTKTPANKKPKVVLREQ